MDLNPDEVRIKREMADACERVIGIFDGTKWHRSGAPVVRRRGAGGRDRDRHRARPPRRSRRGASAGVEIATVEPDRAGSTSAARPGPATGYGRRAGGSRLMTTMAAVDLGAQSGRVALGRFDGERLAVSEVHRFPNVPVQTRGSAPVGRPAPLRRRAGRPARGRRARRPRRLGRRRLLGGRLRAARPRRAGCSRTRSTTATGTRGDVDGRLRQRVPGARALRAHRASSSCRSTRSSSSPRWPPSATRSLESRRDPAPDPRPHPLLARRPRRRERTNATTTQCLDAHERHVGGRPARAARRSPPACCPRSSAREPCSAPLVAR